MPEEGIKADEKRSSLLEKRQALARAILGTRAAAAIPNGIKTRQDGLCPLSFAQERLWFLDQWNAGSSFYNVPIFLKLGGDLDVTALQKSLAAIVARHETLRSAYPAVNGCPVQSVRAATEISLPVTDLSHLCPEKRNEEAERIAHDEASRPFDLSTGPLIRMALLRLSTKEYILLLTLHHIITDGWSRGVLMHELEAVYSAFSKGEANPLPKLPIQYSDFAAWQRTTLQGEALERELDYWRPQLAGAPALLDLPGDRSRPAAQTFCGARLHRAFPISLAKGLSALSAEANVTLFMTLLGAFYTLLYRYSEQDDLVVGTPIANRTRTEMEGLIGFFSNTLALRVNMSGDPSFRELLDRVRETALGAYAHQDLPFEKLVEELQPERSLSHAPLFQVMFMVTNPYGISLELPGLKIEPMEVDRSIAKMDLLMGVQRQEDALLVTIEYNTDLFDDDRMERLLGHFETLLSGIVSNPSERISRLPLLSEAERQLLLVDWNDTQAEYPKDRCIHELFEEQAARTPDAVAVEYGPDRLTYRELDDLSNRLAHSLRKQGVGLDVPVGLCLERSLEMLVGLLGILKSGGAYVPIDPQYPADRISFQLQDAQAALVLTKGEPVDGLLASSVPVVRLDALGALPAASGAPSGSSHPAGGAYVIYTSGSTGRPKGVVMPHGALVNLLLWQLEQTPSPARTLQFTSIGFDVSFQEIFSTWVCGGTLVLVSEEVRRDPPALLGLISRERIERLFMPFAVLQHLALSADGPVGSLREVITAGEQLQITSELAVFMSGLVGGTLSNQYGPTEAHVVSSYLLEGSASDWPFSPPIGKPITNDTLYILDAGMQSAPVGVSGELYIGGAGVARGYLNRPDLTAEKFVPDPFSSTPGSRLYRTGDLCRYLSDGNIEYLGRIDHQVKVRGFRIELGEIESVLLSHSDVKECVVVAREDTPGEKRLVSYVTSEDASSVSVGVLRDHLTARLPEYMVPSSFVFLAALPLTSNGKVDRKALPVGDDVQDRERIYVAPRSLAQKQMAEIWCDVLKVTGAGVHDNFFELGGHSLLASHLVSRIRSKFEVNLPLQSVFESPTIAGLTERVNTDSAHATEQSVPLTPASRDAPLPLSFAQRRLWFMDRLQPGKSLLNLPMALRITGPLDVRALEHALEQIVRRHEVLRTTFEDREGEQVQVIAEPPVVSFPVISLKSVPGDEKMDALEQAVAQEVARPFDLQSGPVYRCLLIEMASADHVFVFTIHHVAGDYRSVTILFDELEAFYREAVLGVKAEVSHLPIQYADYAVWQKRCFDQGHLQPQMDYWKMKLRNAPAFLEVPTDYKRPNAPTFARQSHRFTLPAEISPSILQICRQERASTFMFYMAAFQLLLARCTGRKDILVATDALNRDHFETENLIGFFVNQLVLRVDLSGCLTFRELLREVRDVALEGYANQELPFDQIVEELRPTRDLHRPPIYQVKFAYTNGAAERPRLEGLCVDWVPSDKGTAHLDMTLYLRDTPEGVSGRLEYQTELYRPSTIARLVSEFLRIVQIYSEEPDRPLTEIDARAAQSNAGAEVQIRKQASREKLLGALSKR